MPQLDDIRELQAAFLRIVNKYHRLERIPLDHGSGHTLFPGETHTLEAIGNQPGITATRLAECLGVTKGAVSQTLARLKRKGLVDKTPDPNDAKILHLSLTETGTIVFAGHARFHARHDAGTVNALLALDDHDLAVLARFMALTEDNLDHYLADLA